MTGRLPYPPPFQDLATLAEHICVSEGTVELWVRLGLLPEPRPTNGMRLWKWSEVKRCLDGVVYFFEAADLIKIGFSRDLPKRIRTLRDNLPYEGKLLHVVTGTERMEQYFHQRFSADRVRGEWFKRSDDLLRFIEQLKDGMVPGADE